MILRKGIFIMIFSNSMLSKPELRMPSLPDGVQWKIGTRANGESVLCIVEQDGNVWDSHTLVHPSTQDEKAYLDRVAEAAMSLRWSLETQMEIAAEQESEQDSY